MTGGGGATVGAGVASGAGAAFSPPGAGAGFAGCAGSGDGAGGAGWAGGDGVESPPAEPPAASSSPSPFVPGCVGESCSRQSWRPRSRSRRAASTAGRKAGVSSSMSGVICLQRAAIDGDRVVAGLDRRVGAVVVIDLLRLARQLRRGPGGQRGEQCERRHEGPGQADEHTERVPTDWYHSRPHEAPRDRRRRLYRVDRRRPAGRGGARRRGPRQPLPRPRARRSPRARATSTSTSTTPRPPRPPSPRASTPSCTSPRSRSSPSPSSIPSATTAATSSRR